jgi:DNA repair protein RecO (recombination protein O)
LVAKTVHAIVLRRRDAGESDRRLTLFTLEEGKIDAVAKGARKAGSRLTGSSEPLMATTMQLAPGKKNAFVTQTQPQSSFPGLRSDYDRLTYAIALTELYEAVLPWHEPFPDAYELLMLSLKALERHEKPMVAFVWAQVALMRVSGFLPSFSICVHTGASLSDAFPYVSPGAGGYVSTQFAEVLHDRIRVRAEVLLGLAALGEVEIPPGNLKFAEECLVALYPFWKHIADKALPSLESCVNEARAAIVDC